MFLGIVIFGNSKKGVAYEEEKALFEFYQNYRENGISEFKFENLDVVQFTSSEVCLLEGAVLRAPSESCNAFIFTSEPYNYGTVIIRPCDIPKHIIPYDDIDDLDYQTKNAVRKILEKRSQNPR